MACQGGERKGNRGSIGRAGFQAKGGRYRGLGSRINTKNQYKETRSPKVRAEGREGKKYTMLRSLDFMLVAKVNIPSIWC